MSDSLGFLMFLAATWFAVGVAVSVAMGRRGHNSFGWFVLGSVLGPLAVVLALDARRHGEDFEHGPLHVGEPGTAGSGPVDVLVGYDASSASVAALDAVVALLGERIGRLTVATVVPYGGARDQEREATDRLRRLARRNPQRAPELKILHGHPSTALARCAVENGYQLVAVGRRGAGITKAILGSAASELARDSMVPVLLVGGHPVDVPDAADFAVAAS
jgi:nucleotide-binding universal stress UspA family protein